MPTTPRATRSSPGRWTPRSPPARCWPASPSTSELIEAGAADIIQPDAPRIGGITQFLKLAALAEAKQLELAPHFAMEIHVHLAAAYPIEPWVEHFDWLDPLFNERLEISDGRMHVSDRPGLGIHPQRPGSRLDGRHCNLRYTVTVVSWKEKVRAAEPVIGTFLGMGSAVAAEVCALSGFDWLLVDLEHGAGGEDVLLGQILAAAVHGVAPRRTRGIRRPDQSRADTRHGCRRGDVSPT